MLHRYVRDTREKRCSRQKGYREKKEISRNRYKGGREMQDTLEKQSALPRFAEDDAQGIVERALDQAKSHECTGYRSPLWEFVRALRTYYPAESDPMDIFWDDINPVIQDRGGWGIFSNEERSLASEEEACLEFCVNWDAVKFPSNYDPLQEALELARRHPLQPEECAIHRLSVYETFISMAAWLQAAVSPLTDILLPTHKIAELMNVSPMTISRCRQKAIHDGYLHVTVRHSYKRHRATAFEFDMSRFPILKDYARIVKEDCLGHD